MNPKELTNKQKIIRQLTFPLFSGMVMMVVLNVFFYNKPVMKFIAFFISGVIWMFLAKKYVYPKLGWSVEK